MWLSFDLGILAFLSSLAIGFCAGAGPESGIGSIANLRPLLSQGASITSNRSTAQRWSDFYAPLPGAIINVATENDVAATVSNL